jgi:hypothetical protein
VRVHAASDAASAQLDWLYVPERWERMDAAIMRNRSRYAQQIRDLAAPVYAHSARTHLHRYFRLDIAHGRATLR